jgi:aconitase A
VEIHTLLHTELLVRLLSELELEVEMVLATQCIMQPKPKKMRINVNGTLSKGVGPKDVALYILILYIWRNGLFC